MDVAAIAASMAPLVDFQPDVAIFFRPQLFSNTLLSRLTGVKIGLSTEPFPKLIDTAFHYTKESICCFKALLGAASLDFAYIFHHDAASASFMQRMGVRLSGTVPLPVATMTWQEAAREDKWDLAFVGRSTNHRERHFVDLKRDFRFLHVSHGIFARDALPYYHASRIGLNIHAEPELRWEPRVQQLMAAGMLVVSEPLSPNALLAPAEHFVEVRDPAETYQVCREIIADITKFETIRRAGHDRVQRELSARLVWPRLIERCLEHDFPRPSFDLGRVRLAPFEICAEFSGFEHLLDQFRDE